MSSILGAWMYPDLYAPQPKKVCALCDPSFSLKKATPINEDKTALLQDAVRLNEQWRNSLVNQSVNTI